MSTLANVLGMQNDNAENMHGIAYCIAVLPDLPKHKTETDKSTVENGIANIFSTHLSKLGKVCCEPDGNKLIFYIAMSKDPGQEICEHLIKALNSAHVETLNRYCVKTDIAISNIHAISDNSKIAYNEATETLEYVLICSSDRCVTYCEYIENTKSYGYFYSIDKEKQLINLIKGGAKDDAAKLVDDILKENFFYNCMPVSLFECFKYDIAGTVVKAIRDIFKSLSGNIINEINPTKRLTKCISAKEIYSSMKNILEEIYNYSNGNPKSNLTVNVINYIEKNYADPNLSLTDICNYLSVHISHLSTSFKKQMGIGLSEYIRQVRIDKAKILIKSTNMNISEIAKSVGYLCPHTFTRVFKSAEGTIPSKYRDDWKG